MIIQNAHLDYEADTSNHFTFTEGGKRLLVDADPIAYLAASACETTTHHIMLRGKSLYHVEGGKTELYRALGIYDKEDFDKLLNSNPDFTYETTAKTDNPKNMKHTIKRQVAKLIKRTGASSVELYLTDGKSNFRLTEDIATILKYKGNRSPDAKPKMLSEARQYMMDELGAILCEGYEADDKLSIEHKAAWKLAVSEAKDFYLGERVSAEVIEEKALELTTTILASIDKDLKQVAGLYINPDEDLGVEKITELGHLFIEQKKDSKKLKFNGLKAFYAQLILGDSADNIPSLLNCGDVRAYEILKDCKNEEELFKAALRETYEGFHREMIKSLDPVIDEKVDIAIESGLHGNDNKSNRAKLRKKFKDFYISNAEYKDKHYYHWGCYEEKEDGTVSKTLRQGIDKEDVLTISPIEYMTEVARLVYMLEKEPCEDGSHLWTPPSKQWVKAVQDEYIEKNLLRIDTEWVI